MLSYPYLAPSRSHSHPQLQPPRLRHRLRVAVLPCAPTQLRSSSPIARAPAPLLTTTGTPWRHWRPRDAARGSDNVLRCTQGRRRAARCKEHARHRVRRPSTVSRERGMRSVSLRAQRSDGRLISRAPIARKVQGGWLCCSEGFLYLIVPTEMGRLVVSVFCFVVLFFAKVLGMA